MEVEGLRTLMHDPDGDIVGFGGYNLQKRPNLGIIVSRKKMGIPSLSLLLVGN
jgi:hypothetical protein